MVDWPVIEGEYRAGEKSVNAIAAEHGIPESTLRYRAKKNGWARNPAAAQRERVKAHFAGVANDVANDVANAAVRNIEESTARAIDLNELALGNAELILRRIRKELEDVKRVIPGTDLKRLSEANAMNLATVRKVLTLDDPQQSPIILEVPERGYEPTR